MDLIRVDLEDALIRSAVDDEVGFHRFDELLACLWQGEVLLDRCDVEDARFVMVVLSEDLPASITVKSGDGASYPTTCTGDQDPLLP